MMTEAKANLDKFIKTASDLLSASQSNLRALAEQIKQYLATSEAETNGGQLSPASLQYLHEQANCLTQQNQTLRKFLASKCKKVPKNQSLSPIQILQRQEEERARTAKDLEDTTGQLLANAIFELAAVKQLVASDDNLDELMAGIDALQQELEAGLSSLRFLIADLEPATTLGSFGLFAGLRRYLEKFGKQTGIETSYQARAVVEKLPDTIELAIFRIIQEALQNIHLHAQATQIQVIAVEENGHLQFRIIDNGSGISHQTTTPNERRLGLVGMKDLTDLLDGELQLKSDKNKGTQIILTIPYPQF